MPKFNVEQVGPQWLIDETGVLGGYQDDRGNRYMLTPGRGDPETQGGGIPDAASLTLLPTDADTIRAPSGTLTYTADANTAIPVTRGVVVFLPTSGTISFAVSGGPTLNGGTSTLTRTLAGNSIGYVVLSRIQGTNAYSLTGA